VRPATPPSFILSGYALRTQKKLGMARRRGRPIEAWRASRSCGYPGVDAPSVSDENLGSVAIDMEI
jgi:hypothetical protein